MILSKKKLILIAVAILTVATVIAYPLFIKKMMADAAVARIVEVYTWQNQELKGMYQHVIEKEKTFNKSKKDDVAQYLSLALSWKSVADQIKGMVIIKNGNNEEVLKKEMEETAIIIYNRAIAVYEAGIRKFKKTNSILYINSANILREIAPYYGSETEKLAIYEKIEKRYLQALELDPGDAITHLASIDFYKKELKKPEAFVKARYELASKRVLNEIPIAISFAEYVRSLGQYEKALEFYEALYEVSPRFEFKQAIDEIKIEIKK